MSAVVAVLSVGLIAFILVDAFESIVWPRRVTRRFRLTRFFFRSTWALWAGFSRSFGTHKGRETYLSLFGPMSMLGLFAVWVVGLILGFGLLHWSIGTGLNAAGDGSDPLPYLYLSGVTFLTLGYGDLAPTGPVGRGLAVAEAGMGFGFLAIVIGYLPVLFQAFSHREVTITLLDARAGSPPSAGQFLMRLARSGHIEALDRILQEWEVWAAEVLESQLSFPVLSYYRSQHDNQSWLAALATILDASALILAEVGAYPPYQAQLTFAMARHATVDLALIFRCPPEAPPTDRLPPAQHRAIREALRDSPLAMREDDLSHRKLTELRAMYEPFLQALAGHFRFHLPPILPEATAVDNWQTSAWMRRVPGLENLAPPTSSDEHFD